MKAEQRELFKIMTDLRRLNIGCMNNELTATEYETLRMIILCRNQDKARVSEVVKRLRVPASAVSRTLRNLEEKEYIERTVDKADRRNTFVEVTVNGKEAMKNVRKIMDDFADGVFASMGEETIRQLNDALRKLVDAATEEIEKRKYREKKGEEKSE